MYRRLEGTPAPFIEFIDEVMDRQALSPRWDDPTETKMSEIIRDREWLQITPGERCRIRTSVEETEGTYSVLEMVADPRNGVGMHIHKNEDEHFIVLEGTLHIANGDERLDDRAGTTVSIRKGVPHAWCNLSDHPVRALIVFSPGHIEGLFKALAKRDRDLPALAAQYGLVVVGPPLRDDIYSIGSPRAELTGRSPVGAP